MVTCPVRTPLSPDARVPGQGSGSTKTRLITLSADQCLLVFLALLAPARSCRVSSGCPGSPDSLALFCKLLLRDFARLSCNCCLLVGCLTSQQHASVSQGRICSDNFTCCHTEIEVADPTFYLTQSQYTDTGPTSPSADPITPGAWQGSHWSANV